MSELLGLLDSSWGLVGLALIAFCDTLIGVGFFVFGEVAFLAAGAAFAESGTALPALAVLIAAWGGDVTSYVIGLRFGLRLSLPLLKSHKRRSAWHRANAELNKRGVVFVIVSRFLGPVAWVTPFLAGTLHMHWLKFALAAAVGVFLGVGQFLVLGAVGKHVWTLIDPSSSWLPIIMTMGAVGAGICFAAWHRRVRTG